LEAKKPGQRKPPDENRCVEQAHSQCRLTPLGQLLLVLDDGDVLLSEIHDLLVLDLPQGLGDLADQSCNTAKRSA
jgi:hypothetical protein